MNALFVTWQYADEYATFRIASCVLDKMKRRNRTSKMKEGQG